MISPLRKANDSTISLATPCFQTYVSLANCKRRERKIRFSCSNECLLYVQNAQKDTNIQLMHGSSTYCVSCAMSICIVVKQWDNDMIYKTMSLEFRPKICAITNLRVLFNSHAYLFYDLFWIFLVFFIFYFFRFSCLFAQSTRMSYVGSCKWMARKKKKKTWWPWISLTDLFFVVRFKCAMKTVHSNTEQFYRRNA